MISFGSRLHKFLLVKNLSISKFADRLGYENAEKIYRLFRDNKNKPSFEIIHDISNKFEELNVDWLITGRGSMLKTTYEQEQLPKNSSESIPQIGSLSSSIQEISITLDPNIHQLTNQVQDNYHIDSPQTHQIEQDFSEKIGYVSSNLFTKYLIYYKDNEFIKSLPTIIIPWIKDKLYRLFDVADNEMIPTLYENDKVLAEEIKNITDVFVGKIYVIVHATGIYIKRIIDISKDFEKLYLKSDTNVNNSYPTKELNILDVKELWEVTYKFSPQLNEPTDFSSRINELEILQQNILQRLILLEHK